MIRCQVLVYSLALNSTHLDEDIMSAAISTDFGGELFSFNSFDSSNLHEYWNSIIPTDSANYSKMRTCHFSLLSNLFTHFKI